MSDQDDDKYMVEARADFLFKKNMDFLVGSDSHSEKVVNPLERDSDKYRDDHANAKKTLFRFHTGSFRRSMATTVEVDSLADLVALIEATYNTKVIGELIFDHSGIDQRNGWDTYTVSCFIFKSVGVVGMSSGILK